MKAENDRTRNGHSVNFLQRQAEALGFTSYKEFARALGVQPYEVRPLWRGTRGSLIACDADPVYAALAAYVDKQLGVCMSVREELQRKLSKDRRDRAAQRLRALDR